MIKSKSPADVEEDRFWREVQAACAAPESLEMRRERELWDRTSADGLARENWE